MDPVLEKRVQGVNWVEKSTGTRVKIDWDPGSQTGYKMEEGDIEALQENGAISGPSASARAKEGLVSELKSTLLLPLSPIIGFFRNQDAEGIGTKAARILVFGGIAAVIFLGVVPMVVSGTPIDNYASMFSSQVSNRVVPGLGQTE
ncbi:MAG: hypothetical protein ABEJ66_02035, partial [Candidatus Nanohaloarchaea archaeon]